MEKKLVLIDGNSFLNRAFYALPHLTNEQGLHTGALYGFAGMLFKVLQEFDATHLAITFDLKEKTFRHHQFSAYKSHRKGMVPELAEQIEPLKKMVDHFGIARLEIAGYEADDIIGTIAARAQEEGLQVQIITADRDMLQLIDSTTQVLLTKKGLSETVCMDQAAFYDQYQIAPIEFIDVKALMGDPSDHVPGVSGVGEKTALKLIQQYKSVEKVYENISCIKGALRQKLENGYQDALLSKQLCTIMQNIPLEFSLEEFKRKPIDQERLLEDFTAYQFTSLLKKLSPSLQTLRDPKKPVDPVQWHSLQEQDRIYLQDADTAQIYFEKLERTQPIYAHFLLDEGPIQERRIETVFFKGNGGEFIQVSAQAVEGLHAFLEDPQVRLIGFDMKPAFVALRAYGIYAETIWYDLLLAEHLIDATASSYTPEKMAVKYGLGQVSSLEEIEGKGKKRQLLACQELPVQCTYCATLLGIMQPLWEKNQALLKEMSLMELFREVEMPLLKVLGEMEYVGIAVDAQVLEELHDLFEREIEKIQSQVYQLAGKSFNINSPKQLGEVLFDQLKLPVIKKTKTGYSTDSAVLEALSGHHEIIEWIGLYRQYTKLMSTYVEGLTRIINPVTGRIHSTFHQTITTTGRISSTEPNLQNIPVRQEIGRELRRVFIAQEGSWLLDADYSQIELRILAHIAQDKNMLQAFKEGEDIHTATASLVFDTPLAQVTREQRSAAKAVNFGIVYGISDFGLARNLSIDRHTAKEYIDLYFAKYPAIKEYMERIVETAQKQGYVNTFTGRRRYIPEISSPVFHMRNLGKRLAMNTPIQSSAADIIKIAMVKVASRLRKEGYQARLVLQVHDELILECPKEETQPVALLLQEEMEGAASLRVRLVAEVSQGRTWYDAK